MRVIAGRLRGRKLAAPSGTQTRPTPDRVKETLFNILGARFALPGAIPSLDVLDLFAGTGGLGIEAMSRGARSCLFVEHDRRSLAILRQNLARLELLGPCRVSGENVWTMRIPPPPGAGYGLVFVDPPYREADNPVRLADLFARIAPCVMPDGIVVFRHERCTSLPTAVLSSLQPIDERALGRMRLALLVPSAGDRGAPDSGAK